MTLLRKNFGKWERGVSISSSVGAYAIEKIFARLIIPVTAQWSWAVHHIANSVQDSSDVNTTACKTNNCTIVFRSTFDFSTAPYEHERTVTLTNGTLGTNSHDLITEFTPLLNTSVAEEKASLDIHLALAFMAYPMAAMISSPVAGLLGDVAGFDLPMVGSLSVFIVIAFLYAFFSSFGAVFIAQLLQGIGFGLCRSNVFGRVYAIYPQGSPQGKIMLGVLLACNSFDFFGSLLSGILYESFGQLITFLSLIPVDVILLIAILSAFCFRRSRLKTEAIETKKQECHPLVTEAEPISTHDQQPQSTNNERVTYYQIATDLEIFAAAGVLAAAWFPKACMEPIISVWIEQQFAGGATVTGCMWGVSGLAVVVANVISAYVARAYPEHICLYTAINLAMCSLPTVILPLLPLPLLAAISIAMYVYFACAARYGAMSLLSNVAHVKFHHQAYGRVIGIANIGNALPYIVGPLTTVSLYDSTGFQSICIIMGLTCLLYSPLLYFAKYPANTPECDYPKAQRQTSENAHILPQKSPTVHLSLVKVQPESEHGDDQQEEQQPK